MTEYRKSPRVTFSRATVFSDETARQLLHAGAAENGVADPLLIALAGDVIATEARELKFTHMERPFIECLTQSIRKHPHCAKLWSMGRVDGANTHAFEITE